MAALPFLRHFLSQTNALEELLALVVEFLRSFALAMSHHDLENVVKYAVFYYITIDHL